MKVVVVSREGTDYTRTVIDFLHDFETRTGKILDIISPDSRDGMSFCETYGIVEYPTIIAMSDGGIMQNMWRGLPLPTISELSYYA